VSADSGEWSSGEPEARVASVLGLSVGVHVFLLALASAFLAFPGAEARWFGWEDETAEYVRITQRRIMSAPVEVIEPEPDREVVCDSATLGHGIRAIGRDDLSDGILAGPFAWEESPIGPALARLRAWQGDGGDWPEPREGDRGSTGLAVLALVGAGSHGVDVRAVRRGLDAIARHATPEGALAAPGPEQLRSHAIATLALVETARRNAVRDRIRAADALHFLETEGLMRLLADGSPLSDAHRVIDAAWCTLALESAQRAGFPVSSHDLAALGAFAGRLTDASGYVRGDGLRPTATAAAMLCWTFDPARGNDLEIARGDFVLARDLDYRVPTRAIRSAELDYAFFGSLALRECDRDGATWRRWSRAVREAPGPTGDTPARLSLWILARELCSRPGLSRRR
jgi:hypothetical protein